MRPIRFLRSRASFALFCGALTLTGCANVDFDRSVQRTNQDAADFTHGHLTLAQTQVQRAALERISAELLQHILGQDEAVHLALANSPAMQAILAENWASAAETAQSARLANPLFAFSHVRSGAELDIERTLSLGLLDLLTLPQRHRAVRQRLEQAQLHLTADVVSQVTQVRLAWVKAVAAQQTLDYAKQVFSSAEASAELARRMQAQGNFNKLQRARQQAFYVDATMQLANARYLASTTREELGRVLGLTDAQGQQLKLPDRLPDLPAAARDPASVSQTANAERLDVRLAQAAFEAAATAQGLNITALTSIELGLRHDTKFDDASGAQTSGHGYEISVRLPIFDWGGMQRDAMNARTLAAANRLEATVRNAASNLRSSYAAYRTAYDIARYYRDEIVPLRKSISDENLLRYNGMLISVFDLLADSRDQIGSVMAAIAAEQQFWLADAALRAAELSKPMFIAIEPTSAGSLDTHEGEEQGEGH